MTGARAAPVYPLLHKVIRTNSTSVGHTIQEQKRLESRLPLTRSILFPTSILTMFSLVAYVESSFSHTLRPSKVERQEQSYAGGHRKRHANVTQTHTQAEPNYSSATQPMRPGQGEAVSPVGRFQEGHEWRTPQLPQNIRKCRGCGSAKSYSAKHVV